MKSQRDRVLEVLSEGPCTSAEVAVLSGLPRKHAAAYLSGMESAGVVCVFGAISRRGKSGWPREKIYELPHHQR